MIQYSIIVLIDCHIDMYRRSLVCACAMYVHTHACVCVCVDTSVYIYAQMSSSLLEYVKKFNKHSSLAIFDEHLVRQTNQGWPKILAQCPLETALMVLGGRKGGAMGLQPHLILRMPHRILIFYHRNIFFPVK